MEPINKPKFEDDRLSTLDKINLAFGVVAILLLSASLAMSYVPVPSQKWPPTLPEYLRTGGMGAMAFYVITLLMLKEKEVRQWFVAQDVIEGVIYLPENLFYNTTAPGIIIVLNRAKPKSRAGKMLLLNASRDFVKGDPKNYLPEEAVTRIAETFLEWKEVEKFSRIVRTDEIAKNDFNISPSRYLHTGAADEYQPQAEIVVIEEQGPATTEVF